MAEAATTRAHRAPWLARLLLFLVLSLALAAKPALAQSILRDAETEALFRDMSKPLVAAAGLRPEDVRFVLIGDKTVNAFVAGGQIVYLHSGLILEAESANEVQGVIAHELGHITGGHIIRLHEGAEVATGISILSLLLGAAAMAAGAGDAGMAVMAAGQQAAMSKFLAFTRTQESSADQAGASFLRKAGVTGKGSLSFFKKLQNQEFRLAIPQQDSYARTHPLTGERLAALENVYKTDPAWNTPPDKAIEEKFQRVKAKLAGFVEEPRQTLIRYPESNRSLPARYARAYAWHKSAYPDRAAAEVESLLKDRPQDPYFLELKGQILLESGKPAEALGSLRQAVQLAPDPLISSTLGHALIATEDAKNFAEAKKVLSAAVNRDNSNPFAWYQLGIVYDREGDQARAALATAERHSLEGNAMQAMVSAQLAMAGIKPGTADCLRAQDIAMASRSLILQRRDNSEDRAQAKKLERFERDRGAPAMACAGA